MSIAESVKIIRDSILACELNCGRPAGSVRLMAVSKFHVIEEITLAAAAGITLFGENRVQEAQEKFPTVFSSCLAAELHLIGTLQRNKVKKAVQLASCIQSVDRIELLDEIEKQCTALNKKISVLFEVHTGEESKAGFAVYDDLYAAVEKAAACTYIECAGFMTMAPFTTDEYVVRKSFVSLRETAAKIRSAFPVLPLGELSMGMTNDYKIAIEEGSTLVRIGTAIFGHRTLP